MAKAFFSRRLPFGLIPVEDNSDYVSFDSYPVEADPYVVRLAAELRSIIENAQAMYDNMPAPEEAAQSEADYFSAQLSSIVAGYINGE